MRRLSLIAWLLAAAAPSAYGQLYLLAGTPTKNAYSDTFAAALFRVGDNGSLTRTATLVPQGTGIDWVGISYEWRKIVIMPRFPDNSIIVVDFDEAKAVKRCGRLHGPTFPSRVWLSASPGRGPSVDWEEAGLDAATRKAGSFREGMVLDPSVPCETSIATVMSGDIRYLTDEGSGSFLWTPSNGAHITVDERGMLVGVGDVERKELIPLGYEVPADMRKGWSRSNMTINDSRVLEVDLYNDDSTYRIVVLRESDHTWHTVTFEGGPDLRGFGRYIAATEYQDKSGRNPKSAGMEEWKKGSREMGPDLAARLASHDVVMPGKLDLYDIDTEKMFSITTNQGDSEILLVEGGLVYWRAANHLYSAPITDTGIGVRRLLATDEAIRDAHYAFIKQ